MNTSTSTHCTPVQYRVYMSGHWTVSLVIADDDSILIFFTFTQVCMGYHTHFITKGHLIKNLFNDKPLACQSSKKLIK